MKLPERFVSTFELLRFLKQFKLTLFGVFAALTSAAAVVITLGVIMRDLIDGGFGAEQPQILNETLMALGVAGLIVALTSFARSYLSSRLGESVSALIRQAVFEKLMMMNASFYDKIRLGDVISRLNNDTMLIQLLVGGSASTALRNILQFFGAAIMAFLASPKLAALACFVVPLALLPILFIGSRVRILSKEAQDQMAQASAYGQEILNAHTTVQSFNAEQTCANNFEMRQRNALEAAKNRIFIRSFLTSLVIFCVFSAVSFVLWSGAHHVLANQITAGELVSFIFYMILLAGSLNSISEFYCDWQRACGAADRIIEVLHATPAVDLSADFTPLPTPVRGAIAFHNVSFAYPARPDQWAIADFSLNIKAGETVALVGASGAGKSTIFQLLLRFFNPTKGNITIDGLDLTDISPEQLRSQIGWVTQDPVVFNGTVYDNIKFGAKEVTFSDVEEAAKAAYALDFIRVLPKGFGTPVGDRGTHLSSGQRQRIAIARTILKNPKILFFDEATNSLDANSEHHVRRAIEKLMSGRTTIVVAHRLSTVLKADRIVVLDQGCVVAVGSHTTLMRQSPIYKRFASLQFSEDAINAENSTPKVA
jgi:ATP-binding cassette subfamily B protein